MRISGLASGIDTEGIIQDLMRAERIPVDRVYKQKVKTEWKRDAYRSKQQTVPAAQQDF